MIRSRLSLLGLLLAAIGLMALFASSAQAETGAKWLILKEGKLESLAEMESETFETVAENNTITFLGEIAGITAGLLCTTAALVNSHPSANGSTKNGSWMKFTSCVVFNAKTKETLSKCSPHSPGKAAGTLETRGLHVLLKLHELAGGVKDDLFSIIPDNVSEEVVTIEMGASCALGEEVILAGVLAVWECGGNTKWLEHLTVHLITEFAPLTTLNVAGDAVTVDGSLNLTLASGRQFAGDPA